MAITPERGRYVILEDARLSYDKNNDCIILTSADPDLAVTGHGFRLNIRPGTPSYTSAAEVLSDAGRLPAKGVVRVDIRRDAYWHATAAANAARLSAADSPAQPAIPRPQSLVIGVFESGQTALWSPDRNTLFVASSDTPVHTLKENIVEVLDRADATGMLITSKEPDALHTVSEEIRTRLLQVRSGEQANHKPHYVVIDGLEKILVSRTAEYRRILRDGPQVNVFVTAFVGLEETVQQTAVMHTDVFVLTDVSDQPYGYSRYFEEDAIYKGIPDAFTRVEPARAVTQIGNQVHSFSRADVRLPDHGTASIASSLPYTLKTSVVDEASRDSVVTSYSGKFEPTQRIDIHETKSLSDFIEQIEVWKQQQQRSEFASDTTLEDPSKMAGIRVLVTLDSNLNRTALAMVLNRVWTLNHMRKNVWIKVFLKSTGNLAIGKLLSDYTDTAWANDLEAFFTMSNPVPPNVLAEKVRIELTRADGSTACDAASRQIAHEVSTKPVLGIYFENLAKSDASKKTYLNA